jgi:hypothetical protein
MGFGVSGPALRRERGRSTLKSGTRNCAAGRTFHQGWFGLDKIGMIKSIRIAEPPLQQVILDPRLPTPDPRSPIPDPRCPTPDLCPPAVHTFACAAAFGYNGQQNKERQVSNPRFDRRDFHRLTSAALGGLAAGSVLGCNRAGDRPAGAAGEGPAAGKTELVKADVHLCRGLNECKGQGKDGKNECRGQGVCATAKEHTCGGQNDCKNLGGCGEKVGANDCKGQGGCAVPLMDDAWKTLRERKEAEWKQKDLHAGPAPAKAE